MSELTNSQMSEPVNPFSQEMTSSQEISLQMEICGLEDYLERPYQWSPLEDSQHLPLIAILCPTQSEIPRMTCQRESSDLQLGYLDYLAERVAWMMLQEESFQSAQQIIEQSLRREGWSQIELPSKNATALDWGLAVTAYHFEFQEWLKGLYTNNQADLSFPMQPVTTTVAVKEQIEQMPLEEWMTCIATIYKELD